MSAVKVLRRFACPVVLSVLSVLVNLGQVPADNYYFDVNGATAGSGVTDGSTYSWEDPNWNNNVAAGTAATIDYVDGNFPRFAAAADATGSYTVTANANHTTVGMILEDGADNSTLTINGTGTIGITGNAQQGFIVRGSSNLKIFNNITGDGPNAGISFSTSAAPGSGSLFLYGNNTFQGGIDLATLGGLNFNTANSLGHGPITMSVNTAVLANPDSTAPITVNNSVTMPAQTTANRTVVYTGHDPVTFTNWKLGNSPPGVSFTNVLQVGNTPFPSARQIINNLAGTANSNLNVASPDGVNGTLVLTGNSTYGGAANGGVTMIGQITGSTTTPRGPSTGNPALEANEGTTLPTNSLLLLNGGVLETSGTFNRPLAGSFGNKMAWVWPSNSTTIQTQTAPGGGGFSAIGSQLTVNINGDNSGLSWGEALGDVGSKILGPLKFGSVNSNAKTLFVNPVDLNGLGTAGVTRTVTVTGGAGGDSTEMSGVISNSGMNIGLTKNGTGKLILSAANTYGGATNVDAGTLLVNGVQTGTGTTTVAAGATLGGTGKVGGAVTNNGAIAPGAAGVGTLSAGGNVTDGASAIWSIELSGATADKLAVTGNIDLSAVDTLNVTGTGSGTSWIIGTYTGTETGAFDTISAGYTVSYAGGNIRLNAVPACAPGDLNCDGHEDAGDYVFWRKNNSTPAGDYNVWRANFGNPPGAGTGGGLSANSGTVPEPSSFVLVMLGFVAMVGRRRGR